MSGPSRAAARVLATSARYQELAGRLEEGLRLATAALAMATELGLEEVRVHAMTTIGGARFFLGDPRGEEVLREALDIALAANLRIAGTVLNNLSVMASITDTRGSMALLVESRDFAERMGDREQVRFTEGNLAHDLWATGRWDDALTSAGNFIAACESGSPHVLEYFVREVRGMLRFARGETEAAIEDFRRARELENERGEQGHRDALCGIGVRIDAPRTPGRGPLLTRKSSPATFGRSRICSSLVMRGPLSSPKSSGSRRCSASSQRHRCPAA